jgi:hypothetical protein
MDDDFWKKAGEAIDAQVKELAEKRAINTAKQLNEIYEATRKEMNDKTWTYKRDLGALYREATAKIERLEALINFNNSKHTEVLNKYNTAVEENIRLNKEIKEMASGEAYNALIDALIVKNSSLQSELDNLALASHSDKGVAIRDDELRDQFACAALEGLVSNGIYNPESNARWAYQQADAMLKAREKK